MNTETTTMDTPTATTTETTKRPVTRKAPQPAKRRATKARKVAKPAKRKATKVRANTKDWTSGTKITLRCPLSLDGARRAIVVEALRRAKGDIYQAGKLLRQNFGSIYRHIRTFKIAKQEYTRKS